MAPGPPLFHLPPERTPHARMPPPLVVPFTKMNGAGNDFLVLDNRFLRFSEAELAALARRFCPRRTGVGADGLLALDPPDAPGADFRMRYRNADGSLATMCGNGARCLARFARRGGLAGTPAEGGARLTFDTDAGRYAALVPDDEVAGVRLHVPPPRAFGEVALDGVVADPVYGIWTGTEHAVVFVPDVAQADVETTGAAIRRAAAFQPAGTNADFVEIVAPGDTERPAVVRARTFEKGVEAETLACGTGALAAALAARLAGRVAAERVAVEMPGGTLTVAFRLAGDDAEDVAGLTLEGPAEVVYEGTLAVTPAMLAV